MVINSLGNGGYTLRLFSPPLVLGAKEGEEEGWGLGGGNRVPLSGSCDIIPGRAGCFPEVLTRGCAEKQGL